MVALIYWRRSGVRNQFLYGLSWASPLAYACWMVLLLFLAHDTSRRFGQWIYDTAVGFMVAAPIFGIMLSVMLLVSCAFVSKTQRSKLAIPNGFMFFLWLASVIPPN